MALTAKPCGTLAISAKGVSISLDDSVTGHVAIRPDSQQHAPRLYLMQRFAVDVPFWISAEAGCKMTAVHLAALTAQPDDAQAAGKRAWHACGPAEST